MGLRAKPGWVRPSLSMPGLDQIQVGSLRQLLNCPPLEMAILPLLGETPSLKMVILLHPEETHMPPTKQSPFSLSFKSWREEEERWLPDAVVGNRTSPASPQNQGNPHPLQLLAFLIRFWYGTLVIKITIQYNVCKSCSIPFFLDYGLNLVS